MYLLVYKGHCKTATYNGIKFGPIRTACVDDEKIKQFMGSDGRSLYDDIEIVHLEKKDVVPEKEKKEPVKNVYTVENLRANYKLDELRIMCKDRGINSEGSKTELCERIAEYEAAKVQE